jgi:hypothetical protein
MIPWHMCSAFALIKCCAYRCAVLQVLSGSSSEEDDAWGQPDEEEEDTLRRSAEVRVVSMLLLHNRYMTAALLRQ